MFVDCCWGTACGIALVNLAAHYIAMGLVGAGSLPETGGDGGGVISGGQVTSVSFETMKITYSAPQFAAASKGSDSGLYGLDGTPYGQRYLEIYDANTLPFVAIV